MSSIRRKKSTAVRLKKSSKLPPHSATTQACEPAATPCSVAFARSSTLEQLLELPLLTREQELKAKPEQLFAHNLKFAIHMAAKRPVIGDLDQYVASAIVGLWKAASTFDPGLVKDGKFASFAVWHVRREMQLTKRALRPGVSLPFAIERMRAALLDGNESVAACERKKRILRLAPDVCSLDAHPIERDDPGQANPADQLARASTQEEVMSIFRTLPPRFQAVLRMRLGLDRASDPLTLESAGKKLRVTRERVRQIEFRALRLFRFRLRKAGIGPEALKLFEK